MASEQLKYLFRKFVDDTATPAEVREFWTLFEKLEEDDPVKKELWKLWNNLHIQQPVKLNWENTRQRLYEKRYDWEQQSSAKRIRLLLIKRFSAAAAILLLLGLGLYSLLLHKPVKEFAQSSDIIATTDIAPGGNKAILTLGNGQQITLDSAKNGMISQQGGTKVIKLKNGQLAYNNLKANKATIVYNTISTPRGGQYEIELSDGTKVWLNAASSIYFPNKFKGQFREVRISGEAYFEVTKNKKQPFKVLANGMEVKVLGTHFDVMAYNNESVTKVTLLEGQVNVTQDDKALLLAPGEQARLNPNGELEKLEGVDLQGIIAWKNKQFWFNDDDINTVMRQLARWYNINIVIKGNIPQHFEGFIPRDVSVSKVFEALQATSHLHYKIENNTIIVSP